MDARATGCRQAKHGSLNRLLIRMICAAAAAMLAQAGTVRRAAAADPPQRQYYSETEIWLKFAPNCPQAFKDSTFADLGATVEYHSGLFDDYRLAITSCSAQQAVSRYEGNENIEYIEPDALYYLCSSTPNDSLFFAQWALRNYGQALPTSGPGTPGADIAVTRAWCSTTGSREVVVAIIDTGVRWDHPDLAANIYTNPADSTFNSEDDDGNGKTDDVHGWDFADNDNDPTDTLAPHGTEVAGIVGAVTDNGIGVAGVAPHVSILPLRIKTVYGHGQVVEAMDYLLGKLPRVPDVVNFSIESDSSNVMRQRIARANSLGIAVVCAAGNSGTNDDQFPIYPASYEFPNVIAVTGTSNTDSFNDDPAHLMNWGPTSVDVAAPGVDIYTTSDDPNDPALLYRTQTLTSFATPIVSGIVALMRAVDPSITPSEARATLISTVDHVDSLEGKIVSEGRVNAHRAIAALIPSDAVLPETIDDLHVVAVGDTSITLDWTAPGDDGATGQACCYDVRYARYPINSANFDTTAMVPLPPNPVGAGSNQEYTVPGLTPSTRYYVAVKTSDEQIDHWSGLSNVVAAGTTPVVAVNPTSLAFGSVPVGTIGEQGLVVRNVGDATRHVSSITVNNDRFELSATSFTLAGGESTTVVVTFRPDSLKTESGTLEVTSDDPQRPVIDVTVGGAGTNALAWTGTIVLDSDFLVEPDSTLTVAAGTTVVAKAHHDGHNVGADSVRTEIVIDGKTLVNGTQQAPVTFTSSTPGDSAWAGFLFRDTADMRISTLSYVEIDYATIGVKVDTLACDLFHPRFTGTAREIFLDRDTRIAEGHEWNLDAPCTVTVGTSDAAQRGEDHARVEIVVNGAIRTQRLPGGAPTDWVVFTSTASGASGADWYGLTVFGDGFHDGIGVAQIQDADFGYAEFPLTLFVADAPQVLRTHFHDYAKDAVTDYASNATIANCLIERGGVDSGLGLNGIHIFDSFASVAADTVAFQYTNGIWIEKAKTECLSPPGGGGPSGTVSVTGSTVVGAATPVASSTGILAKWICGAMVVSLSENDLQRWGTGVRILNSADVSLTCNCIKGNTVGLEHRRDVLTTSDDHGINRLRRNNFEQNTSKNVAAKAGPTDTAAMRLGWWGESTSGENRLMLGLGTPPYNYSVETGANVSRTDSAHVNNWYDENGAAFADSAHIQAKNFAEWGLQDIQLYGHNTTANPTVGDPSCSLSNCDISGLSSAIVRHGPLVAIADDEGAATQQPAASTGVDLAQALPTVFRLAVPRPSPASSGAVVDLEVPSPGGDPVDLAVFDVRGRRVRTLQQGTLEAGRHSFAWDLRDGTGARIAAGVYFVRVTSPGYTRVEKLVVLR
ncbi:MAG: S8 family serine peptidase [bacterium]